MKTTITYKHNGVSYSHIFATRVSYGTVERYLIMEKRMGLSAIRSANVQCQNLL
jgi:hypothetical protein